MNTLENKIQEDLTLAMKAKDEATTIALRGLKTAIMEMKTAKNGVHNPTDADILKLIQKIEKERLETGKVYENAGRTDLAEKEYAEASVFQKYLPKKLSNEETVNIIDNIINELNAQTIKDMGRVMKELNSRYAGQLDNSIVGKLVKEKLS